VPVAYQLTIDVLANLGRAHALDRAA